LKGLTPGEALVKYESEFTPFEQSELNRFQRIYTDGSVRVHSRNQINGPDGHYAVQPGE